MKSKGKNNKPPTKMMNCCSWAAHNPFLCFLFVWCRYNNSLSKHSHNVWKKQVERISGPSVASDTPWNIKKRVRQREKYGTSRMSHSTFPLDGWRARFCHWLSFIHLANVFFSVSWFFFYFKLTTLLAPFRLNTYYDWKSLVYF